MTEQDLQRDSALTIHRIECSHCNSSSMSIKQVNHGSYFRGVRIALFCNSCFGRTSLWVDDVSGQLLVKTYKGRPPDPVDVAMRNSKRGARK
jgi:hypothetical protein